VAEGLADGGPIQERAGRLVILSGAILVCFGTWFGCGRRIFEPSAFAGVALTFGFVVSLVFASSHLEWQFSLGPEALAWLDEQGPRPWNFGNAVPWVGVWMILFATLIPLTPRQHLLGAALSTLTVPVFALLSPILYGFPEELRIEQGKLTLLATMVTTFPTLVAAGMAYFAARHVHGLTSELSKARQMGSYHLKEKIGEGGMGEVWLAEHRMLARSAALKLIRTREDGTPLSAGALKRFEREVRAAAQLRSPHTIEIYDYGVTDDGTFYYVMEQLDGMDIDALVKRHGPQPWFRVVPILLQACHSLGEAHEAGLVHRDIKPANIFLCQLGRDVDHVKILDFGLVKGRASDSESIELTTAGAFVGTPAYASPEMATGGAKEVDGRSDLYSLACVAWFLLTGGPIFKASSIVKLLMKHIQKEPPPLSSMVKDVPAALEAALAHCLAKNPDERMASADDFARALEELDTTSWNVERAKSWWDEHGNDVGADEMATLTEPMT
jgi:serine/threonine-protein kinase